MLLISFLSILISEWLSNMWHIEREKFWPCSRNYNENIASLILFSFHVPTHKKPIKVEVRKEDRVCLQFTLWWKRGIPEYGMEGHNYYCLFSNQNTFYRAVIIRQSDSFPPLTLLVKRTHIYCNIYLYSSAQKGFKIAFFLETICRICKIVRSS